MARGGKREKAGRPVGAMTGSGSKVVPIRVPIWASVVLDQDAALKNYTLPSYIAVALQEIAKALGAKPPPGWKERQPVQRSKKPRQKKPACDPALPACNYLLEGGACSIQAPLFIGAKGKQGLEKVPARYCLVEIEHLWTSHTPLSGFGARPGYPQEAQERDYRLTSEQGKVLGIAQQFAPEMVFSTTPGALDGLPVATEDLIVLGGNGRTMATTLVYHGQGGVPADLPKKYLLSHGQEFGFSKKEIEKFKHPMIVRTIRLKDAAPKVLAEWSRKLNAPLSQQLDPTRIAVSRARFLDERALEELRMMEDDESLGEFLSSVRSKDFVNALYASDVITPQNAPEYTSAPYGLLSDKGKTLVQDLLVAVILPDADQIHALGPGPVGTIARAAPYLLQTNDMGEYNLIQPLRLALKDRLAMKATNNPLSNFLRQENLLSGGRNSPKSSLAELLLLIFVALETSPVKFLRVVRQYVALTKVPGSGQGGLFAAEVYTPYAALRQAAKGELKYDPVEELITLSENRGKGSKK